MERKELICIGCPLGCNLTVEMDGGQVVSVNGNTCKRGENAAIISLEKMKGNVSTDKEKRAC